MLNAASPLAIANWLLLPLAFQAICQKAENTMRIDVSLQVHKIPADVGLSSKLRPAFFHFSCQYPPYERKPFSSTQILLVAFMSKTEFALFSTLKVWLRIA